MKTIDFKHIIDDAMSRVDISSFYRWNQNDPDRFNKQDYNAKLIVSECRCPYGVAVLLISDYYEMLHGKGTWYRLSISERSQYDRDNGDFVFFDIITKEILFYVDLKVSIKYYGTPSLGSIAYFNENGYYLSVCIDKAKYAIVPHKNVVESAKSGNLMAPVASHTYKGYPVMWEGKELLSEYFLKIDMSNLV